jgi:hypothetical protein
MSHAASLTSLFEAAEQAAVAGDFASAARWLADAARAQQAMLGPDHPDLANTLNNLAVAHERSGRLDDAEREYRRAHAIAARALPPDDPLVATAALTLREFCEANGRPLDLPALRLASTTEDDAAATIVRPRPAAPTARGPVEPLAITFATDPPPRPAPGPPPAPASKPSAGPTPSASAPPSRPQPPAAQTPPSSSRPSQPERGANPARVAAPTAPAQSTARPATTDAAPSRPALPHVSLPMWIAIGAFVGLVLWLLAGRGPADPQGDPSTTPSAPASPEGAAPASPTPAPSSSARPAAAPRTSASDGPGAGSPAPAAPSAPASASASTSADGITVGDAELCTSLASNYRCTAASGTVRPGPLVFYTRLIADRNTSVVHRWYRDGQVRQSVRLEVPARPQGYRTYSRTTVTASDGEWRVELRTRDGQLLHTERFTVR